MAILPGSAFGHSEQALTARLAYVDFDGSRALTAAMQRASGDDPEEEFVATYCASVLEAIDRLVAWLP